jgi:hypothetical protein
MNKYYRIDNELYNEVEKPDGTITFPLKMYLSNDTNFLHNSLLTYEVHFRQKFKYNLLELQKILSKYLKKFYRNDDSIMTLDGMVCIRRCE